MQHKKNQDLVKCMYNDAFDKFIFSLSHGLL